MAAMSSWHVSAWPLSPSTRAAAATALSFLWPSGTPVACRAGAAFPALGLWPVLGAEIFRFFLVVAMMLLLRKRTRNQAPRQRGASTGQHTYLVGRSPLKQLPNTPMRFLAHGHSSILGLLRAFEPAVEDGMAQPAVGRPVLEAHPAIDLGLDPAGRLGAGHQRMWPSPLGQPLDQVDQCLRAQTPADLSHVAERLF